MNFEGRYYTNNGTLVAVHPSKKGRFVDEVTVAWKGHQIFSEPRKQQPLEMDLPICMMWDENGKCLMVRGTLGVVSGYDLKIMVNPQSGDNNVDVDGCEKCREWKEGRG